VILSNPNALVQSTAPNGRKSYDPKNTQDIYRIEGPKQTTREEGVNGNKAYVLAATPRTPPG